MAKLQLRDYQRQAIDNVKADWNENQSVLAVMATGAGKTHTFLGLLDEELAADPSARALIIAHRKELIDQPIERLAEFWPEWANDSGIVMAGQNDANKRFTVATVQTLAANGRLDEIMANGQITHLVVDEAHHAVAETYKGVIDRLIANNPSLKHLGVTATPIRADDKGLREVYSKTSVTLDIKQMVTTGHLSPPRWLAIQTGISLKGVTKHGSGEDRDYSAKGLRNVFETSNCFELVVESHKKYANNRPAICFTATVDGAYELADTFNAAGIKAAAADGTTKKADRAAILDDFRSGEIEVICNVALWTEGLDLPEISCVHMVRPTQSDAYYMQAIGRGLRLYPGKEDALILDYCPVESRQIVMLGDVLGIEASKEAYVDDIDEEGEVVAGFTFDENGVQWMDGNPMEIVSRQLDYLNASPWRWQRPGKRDWMVLGLGTGADGIERNIAMSPASADMELWVVWKEAGSYKQNARLFTTGNFDTLSAIGEDLANKNGQSVLAQKSKHWHKHPPSEKQLKFAKKVGCKLTGSENKGDVAQAITYTLTLKAIKKTRGEI